MCRGRTTGEVLSASWDFGFWEHLGTFTGNQKKNAARPLPVADSRCAKRRSDIGVKGEAILLGSSGTLGFRVLGLEVVQGRQGQTAIKA